MNPEIKKRWVEALRSGKYKQTAGFLRDDFGFCCLGVLCDVVASEVGGTWINGSFCVNNMTSDSTLPAPVVAFCGLDSRNPRLGGYTCAAMNDGQYMQERFVRASFADIADLIEQHL